MGETRSKLSRMRKLIGDNLRKSAQEIPQASGHVRADLTELLQMQRQLRERGEKVSDTVFLMQAVAVALRDYPELNARLEGDEMLRYDSVNPGVGVNTKNGLAVLVLHDIQGNTPLETARAFREAMERLKANKLTMDDFAGGTFTISNLSRSRLLSFTSIINNSECFILGMGGIHKEALVLEDGSIAARDVCYVTINMNHILVDGVQSADFLARVCEVLEHPAQYMPCEL